MIQKPNNSNINGKSDYISIRTKSNIIKANYEHRNISLTCIPGYSDIGGNEMANKLANTGKQLNISLVNELISIYNLRNWPEVAIDRLLSSLYQAPLLSLSLHSKSSTEL